jgi:hypothetical protein
MKKTVLSITKMIIFCTIGFLAGCSDEPSSVQYFEVTLEEGHNEANEIWIILSDENGIVTEAKQLQTGTPLKFSAETPPLRFSVTVLNSYSAGSYDLQTYHGENAGAQWTLRSRSAVANPGPVTSAMKIRVSDPNLGHPFNVGVSDGTGLSYNLSSSNVDYVFDIPQPHANLDYFVSALTKNGVPMYKFLDQPVAGELNLSLNDFNTFDQTSMVTFPPTASYFSYTLGFKEGEYRDPNNISFGYMTNFRLASGTQASSVNLGFLHSFPRYFVFATTEYSNYSLNYESFGPASSVVNLANEINTTVTNNAWAGYSLSSSNGEYDWYAAQYNNELVPNVFSVWTVRGADTSFKNLTELPAAVKTRFPDLSITNFTYASSSIYKSDRSYAQYLEHQFKGAWMTSYHDKYKNLR